MLRLTRDDGSQGTGYSYTIGTGGSSVMAFEDHLAPKLIGRDADDTEAIWKDLFFHALNGSRCDHGAGAGNDRHRALGTPLPPT